ncbi:MAG: protein kinase domain-containing protein, partial [bacterium]
MPPNPADPTLPNDRLLAVHACFSLLYEGRVDEARGRFSADLFTEAEEMLARHVELERRVGSHVALVASANAPNTAHAVDSTHERMRSAYGAHGALEIGSTVGPFRIDDFLGRGATGEVYRATQNTPTRTVALKLLFDEFVGATNLAREAELLASLEHPSIARLYQTGTVAVRGVERRFLAMQFVPGGRTLADWSADPHNDNTCVCMAIAIADAVTFAHGRGVIHRDL